MDHDRREESRYLTTGQAARLLGIAKGTLLRAVRLREIRVARKMPGGALRFEPADVEAYARYLTAQSRERTWSLSAAEDTVSAPAAADRPDQTTVVSDREPHDADEEGVPTGFTHPVQVAARPPAGPSAVIADMLAMLADSLQVGATFVARADGPSWRLEAVYDRMGMGLIPGAAIPLWEVCGNIVCSGPTSVLIVDNLRTDERFAAIADVPRYGIGSYTGVPLFRSDQRLYGALCALHPRARAVQESETALLRLAGRIILQSVEGDELRRRERRLVQQLAASEEQLRRIYAAIACGVLVADTAGRVMNANEAAQEILGLNPGALDRLNLAELRERIDAFDESPAWRGEQSIDRFLQTRQSLPHRRLLFTRADGAQRWLEADTVPLLDEDGRVGQIVVSFIDITERKAAEQALRLSEERFRALAENATELVSIVDKDGRFTYASPSHRTILGYDPAELIGTSSLALLHPDDRDRVQKQWSTRLDDTAQLIRGRSRVRHADGSWRWIEGSGRAALHNPAIAGVIFTGRDVTDRVSPAGRPRRRVRGPVRVVKARALAASIPDQAPAAGG